jgi:Tfp pilus assembly protein PilV
MGNKELFIKISYEGVSVVEILIALLPLLFWVGIFGLIISFIVKKVKKSREQLEERIEILEKKVTK